MADTPLQRIIAYVEMRRDTAYHRVLSLTAPKSHPQSLSRRFHQGQQFMAEDILRTVKRELGDASPENIPKISEDSRGKGGKLR